MVWESFLRTTGPQQIALSSAIINFPNGGSAESPGVNKARSSAGMWKWRKPARRHSRSAALWGSMAPGRARPRCAVVDAAPQVPAQQAPPAPPPSQPPPPSAGSRRRRRRRHRKRRRHRRHRRPCFPAALRGSVASGRAPSRRASAGANPSPPGPQSPPSRVPSPLLPPVASAVVSGCFGKRSALL